MAAPHTHPRSLRLHIRATLWALQRDAFRQVHMAQAIGCHNTTAAKIISCLLDMGVVKIVRTALDGQHPIYAPTTQLPTVAALPAPPRLDFTQEKPKHYGPSRSWL
ncbi:MAG: hypothetical protein Q4A98_08650 [Comamonadaceae bacterium]|nr:hypothetical protein [Comamonadaceae bacterium]